MFYRLRQAARRASDLVWGLVTGNPDAFLSRLTGVIHVGANAGQERNLYARQGLNVIWIEPIPEVAARLQARIAGFPRQRAFADLVTDQDGREYSFHVANNDGQSSSIFDLDLHREVWPDIHYERSILLRSITLASLVEREQIDMARYDGLVLDTQGSELLVLRGAEPLLPRFRYIKTEVADFEAYRGCCQVEDIAAFLEPRGFREVSRNQIATRQAGGAYFNIVYRSTPAR